MTDGVVYNTMTNLTEEQIRAIQTKEESEIANLSLEKLSERIGMYEAASRELWVRTAYARKRMSARVSSMTDDEVNALNLKIPAYMRGNREKPKETAAAKNKRIAAEALSKIGLGRADMNQLMSDLANLGKQKAAQDAAKKS